jgi:hypothetical protein
VDAVYFRINSGILTKRFKSHTYWLSCRIRHEKGQRERWTICPLESVVYRYSRDLNEIVTPLLQGVEIGMLKIWKFATDLHSALRCSKRERLIWFSVRLADEKVTEALSGNSNKVVRSSKVGRTNFFRISWAGEAHSWPTRA